MKKFTLRENWKLRHIVDILRQRPGILIVSEKPLSFKWLQNQDSHNLGCTCEACDACEVECTHTLIFFGTNQKSTELPAKEIVPNYKGIACKTPHISHIPHITMSLTPGVVGTITIPIQQPIVVSDQKQLPFTPLERDRAYYLSQIHYSSCARTWPICGI